MRAALITLVVALAGGGSAGCESFEVVDDGEALGSSALLTSTGSVALLFGTTAFFTEEDRDGHALGQRRELVLAIARGRGRFVSDLAAWLELPAALVPELGATLRASRPVLEPALSKPISQKGFATLIGVALCRSPTLRYHAWKRFPCGALAPLGS